ncbi:RluA family pseudouridine synthase [Blautia sp. MSJ-19]|uniref:RluA family pseudouridine synthase n=1 Tax=Blautia sp. MSJ-19 TaxID=2841517 RepID=UPI001C0EC57C|nr:RluA family pseudouridine synthase [Blautia sp. MSJ-19]MBU5482381.1 RluA family pseudouridine synthase [Blautia sp. MSJ-19]
MDRIFTYSVSDAENGMIVLGFLRRKGFSRHILTAMKADHEALSVNGQKAGGRTVLTAGDCLRVRLQETVSSENILPTPMEISILYEDEDILVVNKPADMPVHPSIGNYTNTLANGITAYLESKGEHCPFRCINRLDRDTSGALILAKNALSAAVLSVQMRNREIRRTYLAVVEGITHKRGTISAPISRVADSVIERHVDFINGETAITHYQRLETKNGNSLLEIHLETGRTHQIRVHMGYIGHPLPADYLYHPVYDQFCRQPLHSFQLEFRHPITGRQLCLTAPVPEDMCNFF